MIHAPSPKSAPRNSWPAVTRFRLELAGYPLKSPPVPFEADRPGRSLLWGYVRAADGTAWVFEPGSAWAEWWRRDKVELLRADRSDGETVSDPGDEWWTAVCGADDDGTGPSDEDDWDWRNCRGCGVEIDFEGGPFGCAQPDVEDEDAYFCPACSRELSIELFVDCVACGDTVPLDETVTMFGQDDYVVCMECADQGIDSGSDEDDEECEPVDDEARELDEYDEEGDERVYAS